MSFFLRFTLLLILLLNLCCAEIQASSGTKLMELGAYKEAENDRFLLQDVPDRKRDTMFCLEFDPDQLYLGQKKRRRGNGGRFWGNLYMGVSSLKPRDLDDRIKPKMYGMQLGIDIVKEHGVYDTYFFTYNQTLTDYGHEAGSTIDNFLIGYGKYYYLSGCHFGFAASIGYDRYRFGLDLLNINFDGNGVQANLFTEFGVDILLGSWGIKPFYSLEYDFLHHGRFLKYDGLSRGDFNGHSLVQLLGLRTNWKACDFMEFQLRTTWVHEFLDDPQPFYHSRFTPVHGTMTPAIYYYEGYTGRDWAWIGLGVKFEVAFNCFFYLDYDLTLNDYHKTHFGSLGLCLGW